MEKMQKTRKKGVAKVPVVMQLEALECGAASLAMILAYYKKWIPLEMVRKDCGVSRDGSTAKNIVLAARNYGLEVKAFRYSLEGIKEKATFPCIIHWNFNHFVVLNGFTKKYAVINDPARGMVKVPMDAFDRAFTGICIQFKPGEQFEPSGKQKSILAFARKRLVGTQTAMAFVILTTIIAELFCVINPAFARIFLDRLLTHKNPDWVVPFFCILAGLSLIQIIVEWIQAVYNLRINGKMAVVGKSSFFWQVLRMPMEFFSQRMAGDIQLRMEENATIARTFMDTVAPLVINSAMMFFYLIVMIRYSVLLSLVGIGSILINMLVTKMIADKRINVTRMQMRDEGKLASTTVAGIEQIETIKASGAENGFFEKWSGYQAKVHNAEISYAEINFYFGAIPGLVSAIANIVVLILGVFLVFQEEFTIGMVMAFQGFLASFMGPAMTLTKTGQIIQEMRTEMERVEDVMEYPLDIELTDCMPEDEGELQKLSGKVELKHVTFGYSKLADPLIEDFSLTLMPGQRVAFVGSSGCGKSTISKLISGLYQPWSGEILFDGKPISQISRNVFTGSLAVVDQDIVVFEDTIANNIRMWDHSIEDFEVIMAARDAKIHEEIMQRDGGYDHRLMEGGKNLSGGQRQRLEIARVLAVDPTIIIMDEATSALDAKTEYEVVKSIKDRGITCIVVAHRLSTIRDCDEIIVLDQGKVVERGTHEALYRKGGKYTELVTNE